MTPTTFDRLCAMLAADYRLDAARLRPDTPLESLGIDSLGVADLLFSLEDEFKVSLPPEPVPLKTVGEVVQFIDGLVAARQHRDEAAVTQPPVGRAVEPGSSLP